jgi:hypothetical protein
LKARSSIAEHVRLELARRLLAALAAHGEILTVLPSAFERAALTARFSARSCC